MSLIRLLARGIAYKPDQKLKFTNGKLKLFESAEGNTPHYVTSFYAAITSYVTRSVYLHHSTMGWLNYIFDLIAISLGSAEIIKRTLYSRITVHELSLLENGKDLEVITQGIFFVKQKKTVNINRIIDPKTNDLNQYWIKHFEAWVLMTKDNQKFMIYPTGNILEKDILLQVIVGNEIIVGKDNEGKIIDV